MDSDGGRGFDSGPAGFTPPPRLRMQDIRTFSDMR
jgi:hypothetical protein